MKKKCMSIAVSLFVAMLCISPLSFAQCMLANPGFEIAGSGGSAFASWNQFGPVSATTDATHGTQAARLTGANMGSWDLSAVWQQLDSAPGEQWEITVKGWHTSVNPLGGASRAIANVEWRDAGGQLISYESHDVATAATPTDVVQELSVISSPAPTGTVATRILLGVLQGPGDPTPDFYYDEATFFVQGSGNINNFQWIDFPSGQTIAFSGYNWRVKGPGFYGPGPNQFCNTSACVSVDGTGSLHLTCQDIGGTWNSTEVVLEDPLGYGDYIFTTKGQIDLLDPQVVLGIFLWQYSVCWDPGATWWNAYNEMDIEFSRWGNPLDDIGQFVVQPYDWWSGNIERFDASFAVNELSSHAFRWTPDVVEFRSWRGGPDDESPANMIHSWTYNGVHISRNEQPRVHLNLWKLSGTPASNQEAVFSEFRFVPEQTTVGLPDQDTKSFARLSQVSPNPFASRAQIQYTLEQADDIALTIFDSQGRIVRQLLNRSQDAGTYTVTWDGKSNRGDRVAAGVYHLQYQTSKVLETNRIVLIK